MFSRNFLHFHLIFSLLYQNYVSEKLLRISKYESTTKHGLFPAKFLHHLNALTKTLCILLCLKHTNCFSVAYERQKCGLLSKSGNEMIGIEYAPVNQASAIFYEPPTSENQFLCLQNGVQLQTNESGIPCELSLKIDLESPLDLDPQHHFDLDFGNDLDLWGPWESWKRSVVDINPFCMGESGYKLQRTRNRLCNAPPGMKCVGEMQQTQQRYPKYLGYDFTAHTFSENEQICTENDLDPFESLHSLCPDESGLFFLSDFDRFWTGLQVIWKCFIRRVNNIFLSKTMRIG